MSQFPAMPLFVDALLADTEDLSNEEFGAYVRMLCSAWRMADCMLPPDDERLARIVHESVENWLRMRPVLMSFWSRDSGSGKLFQKRQKKERKYSQKISQKNRGNALKRWNNTETPHAKRYAKTMPPYPYKEKKEKEKKETGNGRAAMASSPGFGGRSSATPSNDPYPDTELPAFGSFAARSSNPLTITPEEAELIRSRLKH